ncbi:hypothetical protein KM043_015205 [Ampulex compressa]|nr:hypothetical protein KM043_015205 [Ampulex compressa]
MTIEAQADLSNHSLCPSVVGFVLPNMCMVSPEAINRNSIAPGGVDLSHIIRDLKKKKELSYNTHYVHTLIHCGLC